MINNIDIQREFEEKLAAYRLVNMKGVGNRTIFKLLDYAGSARNILGMPQQEVKQILGDKRGGKFLWERDRSEISETKIALSELKKQKGIDFIPFTSSEYPERLRYIPDPPFCLYVKGKLPDEQKPAVAIIGARACSEYGKMVAAMFGKRLGGMGIQIISGMARGVDGIAQRGALDVGGETFAVLGCGVDICYPPENVSLYRDIPMHGGIMSEYPPGMEAQSSLFPQRNRIISGLADLLLVVEARKRSGTYITVTQALEQGKEVYVVPGRITDALSEGCNYLITQGAGAAISPESIIEELKSLGYFDLKTCGDVLETGMEEGDVLPDLWGGTGINSQKDVENAIILSSIDITPTDIQTIYERINKRTKITMQELLLQLTKLQIRGYVIGEGNYYKLACVL